jgi:type IV secretory pathway TrbD component
MNARDDLDDRTGTILAFAALVVLGLVTNKWFSLGVIVWALVEAFFNRTGGDAHG